MIRGMNTTTNTPCTCGRPCFWTVAAVPTCWACTDDGVAVVAVTPVRNAVTGRVFATGRTVPAVEVRDIAPVA